jgi:hypothetical protein
MTDIHIEPSEKESADDLIEKLIVAHRAYKAAGKSQIAEAEDMRYRILVVSWRRVGAAARLLSHT